MSQTEIYTEAVTEWHPADQLLESKEYQQRLDLYRA